jgi:hypothetical protein
MHAWLMSPWDDPDDAVLLELGRLTWAAINLEDVVPEVRRAVGPEPDNLARAPAAEWIKDALEVLSAWPASDIRETASRWFSAAREALDERNSVLHSVPVTLITFDSGEITVHGQALDHIPRRKDGSFRRISLTEDELRRVRLKLADARSGWVDICLALREESKRANNPIKTEG